MVFLQFMIVCVTTNYSDLRTPQSAFLSSACLPACSSSFSFFLSLKFSVCLSFCISDFHVHFPRSLPPYTHSFPFLFHPLSWCLLYFLLSTHRTIHLSIYPYIHQDMSDKSRWHTIAKLSVVSIYLRMPVCIAFTPLMLPRALCVAYFREHSLLETQVTNPCLIHTTMYKARCWAGLSKETCQDKASYCRRKARWQASAK